MREIKDTWAIWEGEIDIVLYRMAEEREVDVSTQSPEEVAFFYMERAEFFKNERDKIKIELSQLTEASASIHLRSSVRRT